MAGPGPDPAALDCPRCGVSTAVPACHHLELSGAPAVRQALLEDTFQRVVCPACGTPVRPEPRLTCADTSRGWWLAAFPRDQVDAWQALEADAARAQAGSPTCSGSHAAPGTGLNKGSRGTGSRASRPAPCPI